MNGLVQRVEAEIRGRRLLRPGAALLVAVSGGLDSIVLLSLLQRMRATCHWRLTVAHFNHRLRGRSSDADERLVRRTAARWNIPCLVGRADNGRLAAERGQSLEMAARAARHRFLAETARAQGIRSIALAHHADDQVELFFLRLLRGAGSLGLAGMKWRSPSPAASSVALVRPLLGCSRSELEEFARAERIPFREDASNACLDMMRNRVRHELLPFLLRRFQPGLREVVRREMELLRGDAELVAELARQWRTERKGGFEGLPPSLQRRILQDELTVAGVDPEFQRVEEFRLRPGQPFTVRRGLTLCHDGKGHLGVVPPAPALFAVGHREVRLRGARGGGEFDGVRWHWEIRPAAGARKPPFGSGWEWFDADKVGSTVTLRHWQPGDRFHPAGLPGPVKLQDLFTNGKIPRASRRQLVVGTTAAGAIWWVEGLRISEPFKLGAHTRRRLKWSWRRLHSGAGRLLSGPESRAQFR